MTVAAVGADRRRRRVRVYGRPAGQQRHLGPAADNAGSGGVMFDGGMTILLVGSDARTDADGNPLTTEELAQVGHRGRRRRHQHRHDDAGARARGRRQGNRGLDPPGHLDHPEGGRPGRPAPTRDGTEGTYTANKINSYYATAKAYTEERLVDQGVTDAAQRERESNEAGRTMLIRVIQAFTGMQIDHYAEVNLLGFFLLSNAIGGVPVCLNAAVDDPWSGAKFDCRTAGRPRHRGAVLRPAAARPAGRRPGPGAGVSRPSCPARSARSCPSAR